jgi:hypothetical protein
MSKKKEKPFERTTDMKVGTSSFDGDVIEANDCDVCSSHHVATTPRSSSVALGRR